MARGDISKRAHRYQSGDYLAAVDLLESLIDGDPDRMLYRQQLARCYNGISTTGIGAYPESRICRKSMIETQIGLASFLRQRALYERGERVARKAVEMAEKAILDFPAHPGFQLDHAVALRWLAQILHLLERHSESVACWQTAAAIYFRFPDRTPDQKANPEANHHFSLRHIHIRDASIVYERIAEVAEDSGDMETSLEYRLKESKRSPGFEVMVTTAERRETLLNTARRRF